MGVQAQKKAREMQKSESNECILHYLERKASSAAEKKEERLDGICITT